MVIRPRIFNSGAGFCLEFPCKSQKIRDVELLNLAFPDVDRCVQVRILVSSLCREGARAKGVERLGGDAVAHFDVPKKFSVGLLTSRHKATPD